MTAADVLVTGCAGWLGSHITYQLLEKGYKVRGTVRDINGSKYSFLKNTLHPKAQTHLELVAADLNSSDGWAEAVQGVKYVLHVASPFILDFANEDEVIKPAVAGVVNLFTPILAGGTTVQRIVMTSSVASICYGHPKERYHPPKNAQFKLFTEDEWTDPNVAGGYEKSKTLAEQKAWELVKAYNNARGHPEPPMQLVVMNPGFIFGPILDPSHGLSESSNQIKRVMLKTYPFAPPITSSHVDVRDVATAHLLAMEAPPKDVVDQRFCLRANDGNLSMQDQAKILKDIFEPYGFKIATNTAPYIVLACLKPFNRTLRLASDKLNLPTYVSNQKATDVLKIEWRSAKEALRLHALTLMKFGVIEPRQTPKELIDEAKAY